MFIPQAEAGWAALMISLVTNKTPDQALDDMDKDCIAFVNRCGGNSSHMNQEKRNAWSDEDAELVRLKQTMTWHQVGKVFGLTGEAAYRRAKRYKERLNREATHGKTQIINQ